MSPALRATIALLLMIGFYILGFGIGLALVAIAVLGVLAKSAAAIKLIFFAGVAGASVLWSLRPRFDRFDPPGPPLTRETQPELFAVIEGVARGANQSMPSHVYAIPDVNASVATRGGLLGVGGHRVMLLGIPLLSLLTVDQFKAVLAHEFGHYGGGDTRIGRLVYHTRASLARTLAVVQGGNLEFLFHAYARLVMRASTAVARQQEFAADAFAARVTSAHDLASSLQRVDQTSLLFPLFYISNIRPVVEEGYWPPIGQGFATFCALPAFVDAKIRVVADGQIETDGRYDSHPSTEARVAALDALGQPPPRLPDSRLAFTLLRQTRELETMLFKPPDTSAAKLKPVEWPNVTSGVLVPRWQRVAREHADLLRTIQIEAPPTEIKDVIQRGRIAGGSKMRDKTNEDVATETLFAIACGVIGKMIEAGWMPEPSPNLQCFFVRGDQRVDPIGRVFEIGNGAASVIEWADFCRKEGLSGSLAA